MRCPVDKSDMMVVEHERIELDYCLKCSGVWFDSGELELLATVLKARGAGLPETNPLTANEAKTAEAKRKCPICGHKMNKVHIGEEQIIVVDSCPQGDGIWFDSGELQHVLHETGAGHPAPPDLLSFLRDAFRGSRKQQ